MSEKKPVKCWIDFRGVPHATNPAGVSFPAVAVPLEAYNEVRRMVEAFQCKNEAPCPGCCKHDLLALLPEVPHD